MKQPLPDEAPQSDDGISIKDLRGQVQQRIEVLQKQGKEDQIAKDSVLKDAAILLSHREAYVNPLGNGGAFSICRCCEQHRVVQSRSSNSEFCTACKNKETVKVWQAQRRERNSESRLDPSSTVPKSALTTEELKKVTKRMNSRRMSDKALIARLRKNLVATEELVNASEEVIKTMEEAAKKANEKPKEFRQSLKKSLEEMIREEAKDDAELDYDALMSEQQMNDLLDYIQESMKNYSIRAVGRNNFEYSPKLVGLAMSQYIRGPTAYNHWREESPVIVPHPDTMRHKKEKMKVSDGDCVAQYERISLDLNVLESSTKKWGNLVGETIMDEMHLRGDVVLNASGDRTIGFSNDFVCRKKIFKSLLDQDEVPNHHLPAIRCFARSMV